jgi:hypothetical protein
LAAFKAFHILTLTPESIFFILNLTLASILPGVQYQLQNLELRRPIAKADHTGEAPERKSGFLTKRNHKEINRPDDDVFCRRLICTKRH